jgi:hypothetical protein
LSELPPQVQRVQAAQERLAGLADVPLVEHVAVLDEVHGVLQEALAGLDEA